MDQANRQERPEANEVPVSEEDRIMFLIAKCYEDDIFPENLKHGEFVMENGVWIFKVNARIDRLTTAWLKERTVTVIFQGEARDLSVKTREDFILAYENGWFRKKTFTRGFKRGRVHGEGPNVMSYVVKAREIAQWLIAKAEDVVVIRGVEYCMLFKPWMTRAELAAQRRQEDETKVVALRVPLRAMFHIGDLVAQAMGPIIHRHPPEPDPSRPKLMNLKFDIAREVEERFEEKLPMKLEDGEMYEVQLVCKATSWWTRCRWWFHTENEGCPRAEEGVGEGREAPNSNNQRQQRRETTSSHMGRIRIGTWNVKGLGDTGGRQKGRRLKQWIHDKNIDIAIVQETKLSEAKLAQLTDWLDGPQLWSAARGSKGGTVILVHRRIEAELLDYDPDLWGRWVWLKLLIEGTVLVVATMYAPNEPNDRLQSIRALSYCLPRTEHMVIGGNWNLLSCPGLDSEAVDSLRRDREASLQWKEAWGLVDIFRVLHPRESGFSWFPYAASAAGAKRRLDFFLATGACTQNTQTVSESNTGMSDHKPVIMEMNWTQGNRRGRGHFIPNTANLEDTGWVDWTEKHWRTWQETRAHFDTFEDWMDAGLRIISLKYETFSVIAAYRRNKEERTMLKRIEEAEANMNGHSISELAWAEERTLRMGEWEQLQIEKRARWDMILKEKGIVVSDRMSKQCFLKLLPKRNLTPMRELQHPHLQGMEMAQSNEAMCEYAAAYFKDILATRKFFWDWETDLTKESSFWDTFTPRITEGGRRDMNRPVTAQELKETVKSMAPGKAPGYGGLPVEFYNTC
ncbi:hypothetical protein CBR_g32636 [Chara braunii]|uniref:Endonuclease/exonuclease/phosphatase domain-containing protein n=1 Tax=Chara braunii TaxID=69332 RepID=A0A388LHD9_CHABU|nr:hypothetical protein CBR_g32636 [Chara braunii]|eukprot:GBG81643.1 hypothetical protein CBR_g32636 [Chara braunii]